MWRAAEVDPAWPWSVSPVAGVPVPLDPVWELQTGWESSDGPRDVCDAE